MSIANTRKAAIAIRQIISIARSACIRNSVFQREAAPRTTVVGKQQCLLSTRKHPNQAAVAQANRNARIVWALLAGNRAYRSPVAAT
jgi:hypothetical protein